jgi:hypothetical protein
VARFRSTRALLAGCPCVYCLCAGLLACADAGESSKLEHLSVQASAGDPRAQYTLGLAYAEGSEVERNTAAAVNLVRVLLLAPTVPHIMDLPDKCSSSGVDSGRANRGLNP